MAHDAWQIIDDWPPNDDWPVTYPCWACEGRGSSIHSCPGATHGRRAGKLAAFLEQAAAIDDALYRSAEERRPSIGIHVAALGGSGSLQMHDAFGLSREQLDRLLDANLAWITGRSEWKRIARAAIDDLEARWGASHAEVAQYTQYWAPTESDSSPDEAPGMTLDELFDRADAQDERIKALLGDE